MNCQTLDVLIVYTEGAMAGIACARTKRLTAPFNAKPRYMELNKSYAYMLQACSELGMSAGLASSADITGEGQVTGYWKYDEHCWTKHQGIARARIVFDKFSPYNSLQRQLRQTLFGERVTPFNSPDLYELFFDKLKLYEYLSKYAIPTVPIRRPTKTEIKTALRSLDGLIASHTGKMDFARGVVLKDRNGAGGAAVYLVKERDVAKIYELVLRHPNKRFVLQPRVKFEHGFAYKSKRGQTEIRHIFAGEEIVQSYIRVAAGEDKLCNDHQGGESIYLKLREVPRRVTNMARSIASTLPADSGVYALDFVIADSGQTYLLEGNTGPGLNWSDDNKIHETKSKELIGVIVQTIAKRVYGRREYLNLLSYKQQL